MKIADIKAYPIHDDVFVQIVTEDGLSGIGDGSLSGRSRAVVGALEHIRDYLIGHDATRIEHIWQDIFRGTFWRGGPVLQSALAGIDIALWDLAGKALGVPTYRLLGGASREKVMVYRHTGGGPPEELIGDAHRLMEEGWRAIRISPMRGSDPFNQKAATRRGIEHMGALRQAVGDDLEIIMEVHTRLTPPRAIELCNGIEPFHPFFVEDPIRSENPVSFRNLRKHTNVPLGTGEQLPTKWLFRELIEEELVDYLRVDLSHTGGITEARKIAAMGEVHYQEMATHMTGTVVNTLASLHLNMAVPNCAVQEYRPPQDWEKEVFQWDFRTDDGFLAPSTAPGLGVEIDEKAAAKHPPVEGGGKQHWRRPDGSVTDW